MTTQLLVQASLNSVRAELAESFPHLTDDILDWAPAEGMRTIRGQLVEIMSIELEIIEIAKRGPVLSEEERDRPLWDLSSVEALLTKLGEVREATLSYLASLSDEDIGVPVKVSKGFGRYLQVANPPVSELLRYIVRHESYHSGQLVSYLWAHGHNPYKRD